MTDFQNGDRLTGSGNNFSTVSDGVAIPTSTPIFPTMPDSDLTLSTLPTSDTVDRVISESSMVENMGVEVGIATPSLTVEKLFPLPVYVAAILRSVGGQHRKMSDNVDSVIFKSGLVENVGVEVEIASISQSVQ